MEERCPPADYDRVLGELRLRFWLGLALGSLGGVILAYGALLFDLRREPDALPFAASGFLLHIAGVMFYARSKGLPAVWGLMGLGCLFGWAVLLAMPKRCRYCGRSPAGRGMDCRFCGGPI